MSKRQTAVEWLEHIFEYGFVFERKQKEKIDSMFAQAKRIEKVQIESAYCAGQINALEYINHDTVKMPHERNYYNKTYGGDHE
jgi:hypothetical protein